MRSQMLSSLLGICRVCGVGLILSAAGCFSAKEPLASSTDDPTSDAAASVEEATPRETVGKETQTVLDLKQALADGGELASKQASSTNPLLQSAAAYRTSVAKLGGMAVQQAIQIRNAQSIKDPQPLSHDEFMAAIIQPGKPDGIRLPMLPYYQEYAWDEAAQELVVVDFPARIQQREKQR